MTSLDSTTPEAEPEVDTKPPLTTSLHDLTIIETWKSDMMEQPKYISLYLVTDEEVVFFGRSLKNKRDMTRRL